MMNGLDNLCIKSSTDGLTILDITYTIYYDVCHMRRYQVYLDPHSVGIIDEAAEISSFSRSQIIREAIDAVSARFSNLLAAFKPPKKVDYSWWDAIEGSITVGDKNKTVHISENIDEIYYR